MPVADVERTRITLTEREIFVQANSCDAEPAVLHVRPHPHVSVLHNDQPVTSSFKVFPGDQIRVLIEDSLPERDAKVRIEDNGLRAVLSVTYQPGCVRRLIPAGPGDEVTLHIAETPVAPQRFTLEEIALLLNEHKVAINVDWSAIETVIRSGGECVCAEGRPPIEGKPMRYELLVQEPEAPQFIGIIPIRPVVSVREGECIAKRCPSEPGKPGITVTGQVIPVREPASNLPRLGHNVQENEDGLVFATRAGRVVQLPNLLDVAPTLILEGPQRATSGHIVFDGDVMIRGDVEEGVEVLAGGQVSVYGYVSHARIIADGSITVGGSVFRSTLHAGLRQSALDALAKQLQALHDELENMVGAVEQLQSVLLAKGRQIDAGRIAAQLLSDKYRAFTRWPEQLEQWCKTHEAAVGAAWVKFVREIAAEVSPNRMTTVSDSQTWLHLMHVIGERVREFAGYTEDEANILVKNAQQSELRATGNITASGQGFYQCEIHAGKQVRAVGRESVLLGCRVVAHDGVETGVIGSKMGVNTSIELLGNGSSVKAHLVHPGTTFRCQQRLQRVERRLENFTWP